MLNSLEEKLNMGRELCSARRPVIQAAAGEKKDEETAMDAQRTRFTAFRAIYSQKHGRMQLIIRFAHDCHSRSGFHTGFGGKS